MKPQIDVRYGSEPPINCLSNLYPNAFVFDDVECASMEGLLQAFKIKDFDKQRQMCALTGFEAKSSGAKVDWQSSQRLYWRGVSYDRMSDDYAALLKYAYKCLYQQNEQFREVLLSTKGFELTHTIGNNMKPATILTQKEFCDILSDLRDKG